MHDTGPLDRLAIRDLVDSYALAADARDAERFAGLFMPDAVVTVHDPAGATVGSFSGVGEIAGIPRMLGRYERTLHLVSTHRAEIDGDAAHGTTLCEAHHLSPAPEPDGSGAVDRVLAIRYDDRWARGPEGWRFARRAVHVQWEERRPVSRPG